MPYIWNKFGVMHSIPDGMTLPAGARVATAHEVTVWLEADQAAKAERLAEVQAQRAQAAQLVVVTTQAEPAEPVSKKAKKANVESESAE